VFDQDEIARAVEIVSDMRARGLRPMVVLFHWVAPTWVQSPVSKVDLLSRDDQAFVDAFLPVVDELVPKLAGMVDDWVTFDNFEWQFGTNLKEGLFRVDFADPSFPRTSTRSVELFTKIAQGMRIDPAIWRQYALDAYPPGIP
jgi:beta-glucosidase/6-phospho-beta-glucosidase/beta-galactosidase